MIADVELEEWARYRPITLVEHEGFGATRPLLEEARQLLENMPWSATRLAWSRIPHMKVRLDHAPINVRDSAIARCPEVLAYRGPRRVGLLGPRTTILMHLDVIYWHVPGRGYLMGVRRDGLGHISLNARSVVEYDGFETLTLMT